MVLAANWQSWAAVLPSWWLPVLSIAGMAALALANKSVANTRQAFVMGWCFATLWLSGTFWWLYVAMHTYGGVPALISAAAVVLLAAALGLYYACASWLLFKLKRADGALYALTFAATWTMAELARGTWLTGFGWGAVGYFHIEGPLAWYAPLVGSYGIGFFAAFIGAALTSTRLRAGLLQLAAVALLAVPYIAPTSWNEWTQPAGSMTVELLQGNIPQDQKFESGTGVPLALSWYAEKLHATTAELVVAPEVAIPLLPQELPAGYMDRLQQRFSTGGQAALVGVALGSYSQGYTNSVIGLQPDREAVYRYDKHHLVPFGEFTPPWFKWFMAMMNNPLGDFNRGSLGQPPMVWGGQHIAANICYEDLFGEELAIRFLDETNHPTVFANVSNLAWFGDTSVMEQHLNISRMRALELQRPFIRATNTGATAITNHQGKVIASMPRMERGSLQGIVDGRTGVTPYAWWVSRMGLMPWWLLAGFIVLLAWKNSRSRV